MQSVFIGGIVIAGFGAAGMLSALTASEWAEYAILPNTLLLNQNQMTNPNPDYTKSTNIKFVAVIIHCF